MRNLARLVAVVAMVIVMTIAFTGCGSQPVNIAGVYTVDDGWSYEETGEYEQCFTEEEAYTIAKYFGVDTITFTDDEVYLANGETYLYAISEEDSTDEYYTIYCNNGYEFTYYLEDATVAFNCAHYDIWYNPVNK